MNWSRAFGAAALVLLLLFCLLASAPARLLGLVLPAGQVTMQGFSGTLWRGEASRCMVQTPAGFLHLGAVSWRLKPLSLLLFAPRLSLDSRWGSQTLVTELVLRGSQDIDLYDLSAKIPADLLRQFVPLSLAGVFSVEVKELALRDAVPVEGEGRVVWQSGVWNAPTGPVPLGSYALDFRQAPGAALVADVTTLAGEVIAEGSAQLQVRSYRVDITVRSESELDPRLQHSLNFLARPVDQGFHLELESEF